MRCRVCKQEKPEEAFGRAFGIRETRCLECRRAYKLRWKREIKQGKRKVRKNGFLQHVRDIVAERGLLNGA
jgi:hypothetical protein